jgi:uncharacterized protein YndB with AHSA1/START domain
MDTAPHVEVRVRQRFSAPAERVFNAWVDPATAGKWLFATAWRPMSRVKINARAGGSFRFEDRHNGDDVIQTGKYVELVRPKRLVFTLSGAKRQRSSTCVNVEIVPLEAGCELVLVHEGVLPDDSVRTEGGGRECSTASRAYFGKSLTARDTKAAKITIIRIQTPRTQ